MAFSVETVGILCMWLSITLRLPQVVRDSRQRPLWMAIVSVTVVTTLYMGAAQQALDHIAGHYVTYLGTHLATVVSAAAILYFVLIANGWHRYAPWLYAATTVTAGTILCIYLIAHPRDPRPGHAPELPLGYFVLVSGFSMVALTICAAVCGYGARRLNHGAIRWALLALAVGWALNALPWLLNLAWLISHNPVWIAWLSPIDGVSALSIAAGAALPLISAIQQVIRHVTAYQRLGSLWRSLTDAVPHVRLVQPGVSDGMSITSVRVRLYRRVVEIRDAIVILRRYVSTDDVQTTHAHVEGHAGPVGLVDASVTACWLVAALDQHQRGNTLIVQAKDIASVGGDDFDQEVQFLLQVAEAFSGTLTRIHSNDKGVS